MIEKQFSPSHFQKKSYQCLLLFTKQMTTQSLDVATFQNVKIRIESAIGPGEIKIVAWFKTYSVIYVLKRSI